MAIRRGFSRNKVNIIQTKLDNVNFLKRQYNFKGLYHFTDFSNLRNILESGYLYSRNGAINKFGDFIDGADPDIIGKLNKFGRENIKNCVRFYYRPRVSTLYINEGVKLKQYSKDTHIPMPVYLLFDESLIYSNNVVYSDGNATNYNTSFGDTDEFFIKKQQSIKNYINQMMINFLQSNYRYSKKISKHLKCLEIFLSFNKPTKISFLIFLICKYCVKFIAIFIGK